MAYTAGAKRLAAFSHREDTISLTNAIGNSQHRTNAVPTLHHRRTSATASSNLVTEFEDEATQVLGWYGDGRAKSRRRGQGRGKGEGDRQLAAFTYSLGAYSLLGGVWNPAILDSSHK